MQEILKAIEKLKRDIAALEKLVTEQTPPAPKPVDSADEAPNGNDSSGGGLQPSAGIGHYDSACHAAF